MENVNLLTHFHTHTLLYRQPAVSLCLSLSLPLSLSLSLSLSLCFSLPSPLSVFLSHAHILSLFPDYSSVPYKRGECRAGKREKYLIMERKVTCFELHDYFQIIMVLFSSYLR